MPFKVGDKVEWTGSSDTGQKGTVTHVIGKRFEVTWSDGEAYTYEDWSGGSVRKAKAVKR